MLTIFDNLRDVTFVSVAVRMILATVCGGVIGLERESKRRPAGFRTHILICLGAAMTTLTSQYLYLVMHYFTDMARFGAQVVAGVGFIGAGTIIVTKRRRVKGLTTAAGLWASAIIGLTVGAGFYEGAIYATAMILLVEMLFSKLEYRMMRNAREISLYVEYANRTALEEVLRQFRELGIKVTDLEITRSDSATARSTGSARNACAIFMLQMTKRCSHEEMMNHITGTPGVVSVEEL
jgi:putative Mg2+ transporter-C (MgtC) family protein